MKKKQKTITWAEFLANPDKGGDMAIIRDMPDFSKDPYFVNKAQKAKDWYDKHGWPEDDTNEKD